MNELQKVFRNLLADIIDGGRQRGTFREDVNPLLDAGLIMTTLHGILVQGFMGESAPERASVLIAYVKVALVDRLRRSPASGAP